MMDDKNKYNTFYYCLAHYKLNLQSDRLVYDAASLQQSGKRSGALIKSKQKQRFAGNFAFWALSCVSAGRKEATRGQSDVVPWQSVVSNVKKC